MRRLLATACLGLIAAPAFAQSAPYRPASDAEVLERSAVPRDSVAGLRALRAEQRALAAAPDDLARASAFARAAIALGRVEADPRYYGYAESALRPWLAQPAPPAEIQLLRATLRQQRHDFTAALADLDALISADPGNAQARLTRATVLMVQGRPREAQADCAALLGRASLLVLTTCITRARSLGGSAAAAAQTLDAVLARPDAAPPEERIWAETTAAEMAARRGDARAADQHFAAALKQLADAKLRDPYLLTAWADQLLASARAAEVLSLLADSTRIDNLLLRLALAEAVVAPGSDRLAEHLRTLQARFDETRQRGDQVHLREEAMYELYLRHDAARALACASANWNSQREPLDARLLLEAAKAANAPDAARPVLDWMRDTGIEDPALRALAQALGSALGSGKAAP